MPKRTFALPDIDDDADPVVFELSYTVTGPRGGKTRRTEEFRCLPDLPAQATRFLIIESSALAAIGFIERCIATDSDALRFLELTTDRAVMIRREELAEVLEWLTETYSGRPTVPSAL